LTTTTSAAESLWLDDEANGVSYEPARDALGVDVAVLGGGITGLTTALLLKRSGARVAVLEAREIGSGVTGCTTAKVSALQSTILSQIHRIHGSEGAGTYAAASAAAVERVAAFVQEEGIDCDLERRAAVTYAAEPGEVSAVEREAEVAADSGLDVETTTEVDLPYPVEHAVRLADQIEVHPVRYVRGLAAAVQGDGSLVCEGSRVLAVDGSSPYSVRTADGVITAERVVVATHYPILDRGLYFARLDAERSYCIAANVRGAPPCDMAISAGSNSRSLRSYGQRLIVGGEGHAVGSSDAEPARYEALKEFARRHWDVTDVTHRWSAQDPITYDNLPVIGRHGPFSSELYVASGFMKWGMTSGTFAAMIVDDLINGRDNPWAERFTPQRFSLRGVPKLAKMNAEVGVEIVGDRLRPAEESTSADVPAAEARVVRDGLGKKGVYRDDGGGLHAVSLRCTHLGCLLRFNAAERSWDCPCHGSRFDVDGGVLEGPAVDPLEPREP